MRKRKNQHPPLEVGDDIYECGRKDFWPPPEIAAYHDELLQGLPPGIPKAEAFRGVLPDLVYRRIKTWEQACGLSQMNAEKCTSCPIAVKNGKPMTEVGTGRTNTIHMNYPGKQHPQ